MNIIAITVATDKNKVKDLKWSAKIWGWELLILDNAPHGPWKNTYKSVMIIEKLKELQKERPELEAVLIADGYDTLIQATPKRTLHFLQDVQKEHGDRVVVSDEHSDKAHILHKMTGQHYCFRKASCNYDIGKTCGDAHFKHNTGLLLGSLEAITMVLTKIDSDKFDSDQESLGEAIKENTLSCDSLYLDMGDAFWHVSFLQTRRVVTDPKGRIVFVRPDDRIPLAIQGTDSQLHIFEDLRLEARGKKDPPHRTFDFYLIIGISTILVMVLSALLASSLRPSEKASPF